MLVYWHKRDFRLLDNPALNLSLELCRSNNLEFLPIIGLETDLLNNPKTSSEYGNFYQYGFVQAVIPLINNYQYFGIRAGVFVSPLLEYLEQLQAKESIKFLVSHQEHGTDGTYTRDKAVQKFCNTHNIIWHQIPPSGVIRGLINRDARDKLVKKYFTSTVLKLPSFEGIRQFVVLDNTAAMSSLEQIKDATSKNNPALQSTSEKSALACLESFVTDRARNYRGGISSPNKAITSGSRLSQYLAFGSISLRYVNQFFWNHIKQTTDSKIQGGLLGAMQRLHWREHFIQRLETSPNMADVAIHPDYDKITYNNQYFDQYKTGQTGEPLIDACIRCLLATGFINFRMRAMLVSYGVFGLDIDWRDLGRFLGTIFLDYEPGIHWSQIQMQSGITGINTIRVYSPHKQLLDQDPDCIFVKKWVPELSNLTLLQIQDYPTSSLNQLTGGNYPDPIVNFIQASKINKAKTYGIKSQTTKESSHLVFLKHGSRKPRPKAKLQAKPKSSPKAKQAGKKPAPIKSGLQSQELF